MKKDVVIVGGGCIGLMSAYCLQKSGRSVTVSTYLKLMS